jgi:adenosylcobinamide-phosphate synthase
MLAAIANGWLLDRIFGDPARFHPVAGFGRFAAALERLCWRPSRTVGVAYAGFLTAGAVLVVLAADRSLGRRPLARVALRSAVVWLTLGGRSLERAALQLAGRVQAGELAAARALAPTLVSRDPAGLDAAELCRAAVESVAENTSDAVVAPLLWAALLGAPGAAGFRAVNTLDAMVGHRGSRYGRFGWAAARFDDLLCWPAARMAAGLAMLAAPIVGGRPHAAWRGAFIDGRRHPSPNAGRVEGAFAGALSIRLGGANRYGHGIEQRASLGVGESPGVEDIVRAVTLSRAVSIGAAVLCGALAWVA